MMRVSQVLGWGRLVRGIGTEIVDCTTERKAEDEARIAWWYLIFEGELGPQSKILYYLKRM